MKMKRIYQKEMIDRGFGKPFEIINQEDVNVNGRVLKQSVKTMYDPREYMSQYKAEDFYLENILAAGAVDSLKKCQFVKGRLVNEDAIEEAIGDMVAEFDMLNNNLEVKNED